MSNQQTSINPATGDIIAHYAVHNERQVNEAITRAHEAFLQWKRTSFEKRSDLLKRVSDLLIKNKESYGRLISKEMGKPLKEAIAEVEKCANCARYYAENGPRFLADQTVATEYRKSYVTFQPMGAVLAVMPWNFPFWQVFRFALPAFMAGNAGILKHASNVPGCAEAIISVFRDAGLPEGLFQALMIPGNRVEAVIRHPLVRAVTLTGSTPAGRSVASIAGSELKKTVLELGGSDPYLILSDADVAHAVKTCAAARLLNCGQSCISAKRLIVVEAHKEAFEQGLIEIFKQQKTGDPLAEGTTLGPMARADLRDELHTQVERSIESGARLLLGGVVPEGKGAFYPLTVLTDVKSGMPAYSEELFGPVAVIIPAKDDEDALRIAADSDFGLGGAVFSKDLARGEMLARERVDSGSCFVNMNVRSDPRLPFGGVRQSGYGRELGEFGIHEFVNIKSIIVA